MSYFDRSMALACCEFYGLSLAYTGDTASYLRQHDIDPRLTWPDAGLVAVVPVQLFAGDRFDFAPDGVEDACLACVCEAFCEDGETVIDLVGWRLDAPDRALSLFGRCAMLGLHQAMSPSSWFMGHRPTLHAHPLAWLQVGCRGAALVHKELAPWYLLHLPGKVYTQGTAHARELEALERSLFVPGRYLVPVLEPEAPQ